VNDVLLGQPVEHGIHFREHGSGLLLAGCASDGFQGITHRFGVILVALIFCLDLPVPFFGRLVVCHAFINICNNKKL